MLDIFSGLRLVVKRRTINIDNAIFRCHWFFTSTLLVSFSLIITARQYVGQPIECHSVDKIPDSLLNSYCWVQSTFTVPQACSSSQTGRPWEVPYPCIDNARGREVKVYAYYQWVGIVLFVQGLMFHLPYYLWKLWENGLIKAITGGLRVAVLNEQERAKKKEIVVEYIHDHLGCHRRYALKYFLCEFICLVNLVGQLWATNRFFDGQFLRYGLEVLEYSSSASSWSSPSSSVSSTHIQPTTTSTASEISSRQQQQQQQQQLGNLDNTNYTHKQQHGTTTARNTPRQVDPMTFIFPRMTKCSYFDFGSSGDVQKHDALCLLPLNIINEKIYIALWFWFLVLALLTLLVIIYRLCAIISEAVRCKGLISRCKLSSERDIRLICRHCDVGDWFLFYMVAENLDPLIMREIIAAIAAKIQDHLELKRELKAQLAREQALQADQEQALLKLHQPPNGNQLLPTTTTTTGDHLLLLAASGNMRQQQPEVPPTRPSAPRASLCLSCASSSGSQPVSRRNSLVESAAAVPPLVRKLKKRLYNKRLWSADLPGSAEARQALFGASNAPPTPPATAATTSSSAQFAFASAPLASQEIPLGSRRPSGALLASLTHRRRGSLTRQTTGSSTSSGVSSITDSFVMEMASIRASSPCLLDGSLLGASSEDRELSAARWRSQQNARHHHHDE